MEVRFRSFDPFNCWLWLRFEHPPGSGERGYLDTVFDSWFVLGKLGGFNAESLQAHEEGVDLGWMAYENEEAEGALPALMHNLGPLEYQDNWGRCWVDLGTSDALALDVLFNVLRQLDNDLVRIEELVVGGVNEDWPVEDQPDRDFSPLAFSDDESKNEDENESEDDEAPNRTRKKH
ncbi:DUF3531 family protein [Cyanobium sp. Morenito 9A2]|nr:DUF3531 family protein [Cyanobium sp. Morenito 9A2]